MNQKKSAAKLFVIAAVAIVAWLGLSAVPSAAQADNPGSLVTDQRSNWGLKTAGESAVVGGYDSLGWALEEHDQKVYVGGKFLEVTNGVSTVTRPYLAAFDVYTSTYESSFNPDLGGPVLAIEPSPDGAIFVGGEVKTVDGVTVGGLAKLDPDTGEMWPGWNTRVYGGPSYVSEIKLESDGWLYVVGSFNTASDSFNPTPVNNVIRMNPVTGVIDFTWTPNLTDMTAVRGVSISQTQNTVYLVGRGVTADDGVVGVNADTAAITWDGFEMNYCCSKLNMWDVLATEHGTVFVAGEQHGFYVYDENNNMALIQHHISTGINLDRDGGDFQDITRVGDVIYATCHCWGDHYTDTILRTYTNAGWGADKYTGTNSAVVAYDVQSGARNMSFDPFMSGDIGGWDSLGASDGCLWVTGGINFVGDQLTGSSGRDLVRLCDQDGGGVDTVTAVASCTAFVDGDVSVSWDSAAGISEYVIYRTVDGGNTGWRGLITDGSASFNDSSRSGDLVYFVASRLGGEKSELTQCTTQVPVIPPLVAPVACTAFVDGNVDVSWDAGSNVVKYRVYRSVVDGGTQHWRGSISDGSISFVDSSTNGDLTYFVESEGIDGTRSDRLECTTDMPAPPVVPILVAPVACSVVVDGSVNVSWDAGSNVVKYRVYRSIVGGGTQHWRGAISDGSTSFVDSSRSGDLTYFVEAEGVDGTRSNRIECSDDTPAPPVAPPFAAPVACSVVVDGDITVSWEAGIGVVKYRVYRSVVDGGNQHWRGAISDGSTSFVDSSRSGDLTYFVEAEGVDGTRSNRIECSNEALVNPPVVPPVDAHAPVVSCAVTTDAVANSITVNWPALANQNVTYVVRRIVDGNGPYWRGVSVGTSFNDSLRSGVIEYFVEVRYPDGEKSVLTTCA